MRFALSGRWFAAAATLAAGTAAVAPTASAQSVTLSAFLTGRQKVPPVSTPATGLGPLPYNQALGTMAVALNVRGLTGTTVGVGPGSAPAHVHLAPPGANGPIVIPITLAPVGATSFNVGQSFTFADLLAIGVTSANVTALTTELNRLVATIGTPVTPSLYFNVHTTAVPSGEIRGNLAVVPEPGTYALLGTGLAGLGVAARRRRGLAGRA